MRRIDLYRVCLFVTCSFLTIRFMQRGMVGEMERGTSLLFFIVAPPLRGSELEREGREWNKGYLMTNGIVNNVSHLYAVVSISSLLILYLIIN